MLRRKELREAIRRDLTILTSYVGQSVALDMTDINRYAEDFYGGLLNRAFGWKLRNLNQDKRNYPALDLADDKMRIGVQVTSSHDRRKVTETLKKFFREELDSKYDRLIFVVIGKEDPFRDPFRVERAFAFDPEQDIWDTPRLTALLEQQEELSVLEDIAEYLQEELGLRRWEAEYLNLPLETSLKGNVIKLI